MPEASISLLPFSTEVPLVMKICQFLPTVAALISVSVAHGVVLDLDFSGGVVSFSNPNQTLVIDYADIAVGAGAPSLDLRIEAITPYIPNSAANGNNLNGSVSDDLRIHTDSGATTRFRFSLFDGGTETLYDPGTSFSFSFVMYDIDGNTSISRGADQITFHDIPLTYVATAASTVDIDVTGSNVTFTGTAGSVTGNDGLTSFATAEQEDASVGITISDTSEFEFSYGAPHNGTEDGGRNMLWDPGNLVVSGNPVSVVPEPSQYGFLVGLCSIYLISARRRRR